MAHALAGGAAMLTACGQKGALVLPSTPESAGRATLPQTLKLWPAASASPSPATAQPNAPSDLPSAAPLTAPEAPTAAPR
nr:lipoprotein [uncultured Limnohabitans sp.]